MEKRPSFKNPTVSHLRNSPSPPATEVNVHYSTHKTLQTVIIMSDVSNPHSPTEFKIHFNIILTSVPVSPSCLFRFPNQIVVCTSHFFHTWHVPRTLHPPFCHLNNVLRKHTNKVPLQFYPTLYHLIPIITKHSKRHQPNPCSSHNVRYKWNTYSLCTRICDGCKWTSRSFITHQQITQPSRFIMTTCSAHSESFLRRRCFLYSPMKLL
jgi:hypothetical protein